MSTETQAILEQIRALPPQELQVVWRELQLLSNTAPKAAAADPIRSARGMFAGSHLTEALLASRAEERRTLADVAGKYRANPDAEAKDHDRDFAAAAAD
jgi:hypothetical protein